ncbi:DNA-processing protein DprA [Mannheimia massilioguelmaensis]|uniref:DNA-processing protein DprA n=1 Tax=Mannheimia massilioguelmaensis TaxID=1604354 RepID=UPI0005CAAFC0|nr:DNA-processing protein DprA [Mannheimia massilioguelmaensis]
MDKTTEILLRLMQVPKLGSRYIQQMLHHINLQTLQDYDAEQLHHMGWDEKQIQAWFHPNMKYLEPAYRWAEQADQQIIHLQQASYPELLKQIDSAPPILFIKGNIDTLHQPQIAMVGSRHCSDYGEYWAKYFASELSLAGLIITSGLALGIDGFCHRAVVEQQGQTIAVIGSGLSHIYPSRHKKLAQQIIENQGALISEFFPTHPPLAENFPRRNRIISGLSLGTLIVEASERSGSLITANYAVEQNREVFAIPGHIQNQSSQGCHKLIQQGAMLVEQVSDILENLPHFSAANSLSRRPKLTIKEKPLPTYPELYKHISSVPISIDHLAEKTNLTINELLVQLLELELQELIQQENGNYLRIL